MIYVAQYTTFASFEAEVDDHDVDFEGMASPQLSRLSTRMSGDWVQKCKQEVENEVAEEYEDPHMGLTWKTTGWKEVSPVNGARSHQVFDLYDDEDIVGKLVIQRVPCDE